MPVKTPREFDRRGRRIVTWTRTPAGRASARALMQAINANRHLKPKCGAKSKATGEPCRNLAMKNGRCRLHGGATLSGSDWHRPRWPKADAPRADAKLNRKLRDLERAARKREKRVAAMTPAEREQYDRWKAAHAPGPAAKRRAARLPGPEPVDFAALDSASLQATAPEMEELNRRLDEARRRLAQLESEGGIFG